jgi:hypothetical protein
MAELAAVVGIVESAHALRADVEAAAAEYAEVDWLLRFPNVFEGIRVHLVRYAAILGRAQSTVLDRYATGEEIAGPALDPYTLALEECETLRRASEIGLAENHWLVARFSRARVETDMRRRGFELDGVVPAGAGQGA